MSRVLVTTLPSEETITHVLMDTLAGYGMPVALLADSGPRAEQQFEQADALIVVIGPAWLDGLNQAEHQPLRRTLNYALTRSDMLIQLALVEGTAIPPVSQIPEDLRPLAYLPASPLTQEHFARDAREIGVKINQHLKRVDAAGRQRGNGVPAPTHRGLPWNILILISALVVGAVLVIIPYVTDVDENRNTLDLPAPRSSAANAAIISSGGSVQLGVSAGISGRVADRGQNMVNGIILALQERPTVTVDGQSFPVDLLVQDSACSSDGGLLAAELFTADIGVVGVVGPMCSTACFAARGIYDTADYTTVSPGCDAPDLSLGAGRSFNRTLPSTAADAAQAARFVFTELGIEQVAVINDEDTQAAILADTFARTFEQAGGRVMVRISLNSGEINQAEIQAQIEEQRPEMVFYAGHTDEAVLVARAVGDGPLMLAAGVDAAAFIAEMGVEAEGIYTYAQVTSADNMLEDLSAQYAEAFGVDPASEIYAYSYDAAQMLLDGVEAVGRIDVIGNLIVDRVALQDYVRSYQGEGVTGALDCQGTGDCALGHITVFQVSQGELLPLGSE